MAQLAALIVSTDEDFRRDCGRLRAIGQCADRDRGRRAAGRSTWTPTWRSSTSASTPRGASARSSGSAPRTRPYRSSRLRRRRARSDSSGDACRRQRVLRLAACRGHLPRRRPPDRGATGDLEQRAAPAATTLVFFGAKGGAGTTTVAVNCAVEVARLAKADAHPRSRSRGFGEAALFLGMRPRFTRARRDRQPAPARSRIPARARRQAQVGSRDPCRVRALRPPVARRRRRHRGAVPPARPRHTTTSSSTPATPSTRARSARSTPPTRSSSSPIRTCRRCATRSACSTASGSSASAVSACGCCSIAPAEPCPIPPSRSKRHSAIRFTTRFPSDYKTVSSALNSGVPLALLGTTRRWPASSTSSRARSSHLAKWPRRPSWRNANRSELQLVGTSAAAGIFPCADRGGLTHVIGFDHPNAGR